MSVRTAADEKMDDVKDKLKDCQRILAELVFGDVWGWRDYSKEYRAKMRDILAQILEINTTLEG